MSLPREPLIFDGHNDQLSLLATLGRSGAPKTFRDNPKAAIDAARAALGGFGGGFFAVWVPSEGIEISNYAHMAEAPFSIPLPPEVPHTVAADAALTQIAILIDLESEGFVRVCRTAAEIRSALSKGELAAVLHMEGAEAVGPDLAALEVFYAAGLRSLGPVWSRPNIFGHGVPFRFPASPDTGPGLTDLGLLLVERCNALGIMVDLSHLNEAGFWDIARISKHPLVATHSNAHALCASARNLTDVQLDAIAASGGVVGINFATAFLRQDGRMMSDVPVERILDHAEYLMDKLGEDGVALGSDYDGAVVPAALRGVEGLPRLRKAMEDRGYSAKLMGKICHGNWLNVLERTWGA
ncbi:MAG: dipeptidase [Pseudomonadota bacterium]